MDRADAYEETGGCLCGAIRFRVSAPPKWISNCHCASCRRQTGAAVATYAGFAAGAVQFIRGAPQAYASSPGVTRTFCGTCGTPLMYEGERWKGEVHIHVGTFDHPEKFPPTSEGVFETERLPWCNMRASTRAEPR